jgi:hypothetical protein
MNLFNISEKQYGTEYKNHLLQQWVTCVEMSNNVSERRINVNNFFITLNTAIVAFIKFQIEYSSLFLSLVGIIVCILWLYNIENYKKLNTVKYDIILEIEKNLPVKPFDYEWDLIGRGKDKRKYKIFAKIEKAISYVFIFLYGISILYPLILKYI